jgi:hypothetical protein
MCESGKWIYIKDRNGVLSVIYTAFRENDGDEVDAGRAEERERSIFCEQLSPVSAE